MDLRNQTQKEIKKTRRSKLSKLITLTLSTLIISLTIFMYILSIALGDVMELNEELIIEVFTDDGSWFTMSVIAITGLFSSYPAKKKDKIDSIPAKLISRSILNTIGLLMGFVISALIIISIYDGFSITNYTLFLLATVVLSLSYVSIGVSISGVTTDGKYIASLIAVYFFFQYLWNSEIVPLIILFIISGEPEATLSIQPNWYNYLLSISPVHAYQNLATPSIQIIDIYSLAILALSIIIPATIGYMSQKK